MLLGLYERLAPRSVDGFEHAHVLIEGFKRASAVRDRVCVDFRIATDDFAHLLSGGFLDSEAAKIDETSRRALAAEARERRHDLDGRNRRQRYRGLIHSVALLGIRLGMRAGANRRDDAQSRRRVPARSGRAQFAAAGRRPFHTLNPPLAVFDDGRVMSYGSMGGDGQPQFQAQVFTRIAAGARSPTPSPRRAICSAGPGAKRAPASSSRRATTSDRGRARARGPRNRVARAEGLRSVRPCRRAGAEPEGRHRGNPRSALGRRAGRIVSFGLSRPAHPEAISVRSLPLHTSLLRNDTFPARGEENGQSRCDSRRRWVSGPADRPPQSLFQP